MKELGYHGTCTKHRYSIEKDGLDPTKCKYRSDHWLGQGVYFFDDYERAQWWASNSSSQNGNCGGVIFQSLIEAADDEVLNLDDNSQYDCFLTETISTLDEIQKECPGNMPIFEEDKFRAIFFDYNKQKKGISVVIGTFQKDVAGYTTIFPYIRSYISIITTQPGMPPIVLPAMNIIAMVNDQKGKN